MKPRQLVLTAIALLTTAVSAGAQVEVKVTAPYAPGGTAVVWDYPGPGAVYVSPYTGLLTATNQTVVLNCVDFFHAVTLNSPWMATQTWLNAGDLSPTRFNTTDLYLQAAWLIQQYTPNPGSDPNRTIAIQSAIWNIFAPASPDRVYGTNAANDYRDSEWWIAQAQANYAFVDASKFYVLTAVGVNPDNSDTKQQEFLVYDPSGSPVVVPEPASMVLLGTGLAGIAGFARRRRMKGAAR